MIDTEDHNTNPMKFPIIYAAQDLARREKYKVNVFVGPPRGEFDRGCNAWYHRQEGIEAPAGSTLYKTVNP